MIKRLSDGFEDEIEVAVLATYLTTQNGFFADAVFVRVRGLGAMALTNINVRFLNRLQFWQ